MVSHFFAVTIPGIQARVRTINKNSVKGVLVLIEPDVSIRDALNMLLEGEGWQVEALADCAGLLPAIEEFSVLAVISESRVPECTPQEILELCSGRGLPVIFTGHDLPLQGAVDLIRQGATDFLDKPFPQSRLLDLLERLHSRQNG
jgi:DNA-binding NtrC family response regulator